MIQIAGEISEKANNIDRKGITQHKIIPDLSVIMTSEREESNKHLEKTLQQVTLVPAKKYEIPQTAAQEIGWMIQLQDKFFKFKYRGKKGIFYYILEYKLIIWKIIFYYGICCLLKNIVKQSFHYGVRVNKITKFGDDYYPMTKINLLNISDDRIYTYFILKI